MNSVILKDRQKSILEGAIREYIKTAKPVASRDLANKSEPKVSPATIRNELRSLDEAGYLEQPHTSAGRIPTDRGYRFFVDNLINGFRLQEHEERIIKEIFSIAEEEEFIRELSRAISRFAKTFSLVGMPEEDIFYESGFSEILEEPEFQEMNNIKTFAKLTDFIGGEIKNLLAEFDMDKEWIFIGVENPLKEARAYSMIISSWRHPRGFRGFLTLIGPRRMNYAKQKALIKITKNGANKRQ